MAASTLTNPAPITSAAKPAADAADPGVLHRRLWVLIASLTASLLFGGLLTGGIGVVAEWSDVRGVVFAAAWSAIAAAVGVAVGVILLFVLTGMPNVNTAFGVVGAGMARMMSSLACALVIYFTVKPEGKTFWAVYLCCNLLALIVESAWGIKACQTQSTLSSPSSASPTPIAHSPLPSSSQGSIS
jgi:hypothetical protein